MHKRYDILVYDTATYMYIVIAKKLVKPKSDISLNIKLLLLEEPRQNNNNKIIYIKQRD